MARRSELDTHKIKLINKLMEEMSNRTLDDVATPDILSELTKLLNKPEPKPTKEEQTIADKEAKSMELSKKLAKRMSQNGI
jgi:membrane protease subunit (stomatin/prohibitin family)